MKMLITLLKRNTNRVLLATLLLSTILSAPRAHQPVSGAQQFSSDRIELYQALLDLQNPWTVMCVAAHPDDEDGTSLVVMRRKYGAHTVSLFSTFGEGGQNAIGPELYEELGAIRARETMAASEIQGSEPHFLGMQDFGFSKSVDETFKKWGHEVALARMVLEIRKLRPDVIITNHSVTNNDHGHHQATARLVVEAFDAAADPGKFPEQLKQGVTTWQVQRLFVRARRNDQADNAQIVTIDPNEQDPARGVSFAEEALLALQKHATQGPWPRTFPEFIARFRAFGGQGGATGQMPLIRYRLEREAKSTPALQANSHNFLNGLRLRQETAELIEVPKIDDRPLYEFSDDPPKVLERLVKGSRGGLYGFSNDKTDEYRLLSMRDKLMRALSLASGVDLQMTSTHVGVPGSNFDVQVKIANNGHEKVRVSGCGTNLGPKGGYLDGVELAPGAELSRTIKATFPRTALVNVPLSQHLYEPSARGQELKTRCRIDLPQGYFDLTSSTFIDLAPPLEIADVNPSPVIVMEPRVGVSSAGADILPPVPPKVTVKLINHLDRPFRGELAFGQENRSPENRQKIELPSEETTSLTVSVPVGENKRAAHGSVSQLADNVWFSLRNAGSHENLIKRRVPITWVDARVNRGANVGYIRGFDFSLPNALDALGVKSKELSVDEVKTTDLSQFSTVMVDNRVYESQPELISANQKLLDYAKNGGTLVVFYHKTNEWNPDPKRNRPQLAPYKLIISDDRVTDENAPITFLEPEHALLNVPNKIGPDDFVGWIQERGVYYPKEWDPQFHALLQSNDPGEPPLKSGLLVADYGRGHYIYTSMVWYRELRAGVPGAYRMLANMISYGQK